MGDLTLALDGGEWSALHTRERAPGTHWIGGWVGPRAILTRYINCILFGKVCSNILMESANVQWSLLQTVDRRKSVYSCEDRKTKQMTLCSNFIVGFGLYFCQVLVHVHYKEIWDRVAKGEVSPCVRDFRGLVTHKKLGRVYSKVEYIYFTDVLFAILRTSLTFMFIHYWIKYLQSEAQKRAIIRTCFFRNRGGGGHAATCVVISEP